MNPSGDMATGWKYVNGKWYYLDGSGSMAEGWRTVNGETYYLNPGNGDMATGLKKINSKQYYFGASGAMYRNRWYNGMFFGDNGVIVSDDSEDNDYSSPINSYDENSAHQHNFSTPVYDVEYENIWVPNIVKHECIAYVCKECGGKYYSPEERDNHTKVCTEEYDDPNHTEFEIKDESWTEDQGHFEQKENKVFKGMRCSCGEYGHNPVV